MAWDWLWSISVGPSTASLQPVTVHGKFLRRAGEKFLLKAMHLPGVTGALDFNEKLSLRKRLEGLATAHVNTLILTEVQAEAVLGIAGQVGLCAIVEIGIGANDLAAPSQTHSTVERIRAAANLLRGHPALIAILIDYQLDADSRLAPAALRSALDAIVRAIRQTNDRLLVAFKRGADGLAITPAGEDFCYLRVGAIDAAAAGPTLCAWHDRAGARPLVIEFGEGFPGLEEVVVRAFGFGAAGVAAPALRLAMPPRWQNIRMLNAGELPPFAHLDGSTAPLPAVAPLVSVVIGACDNETTIEACLESIGRLQYPNYEVIVIDEASRDRSAEIAAAAPGIRLIRWERAAINRMGDEALRVARGDLIAFTRADCVVDPDWLTLAVTAIDDGAFDACSGSVYCSSASSAYRSSDGRGRALRAFVSRAGSGRTPDAGRRPSRFGDRAMRNVIIRKTSLVAAGGFDPVLLNEGRGVDLSARMLTPGMTIGWCPAGQVWRIGQLTIGERWRNRIHHRRADGKHVLKRAARVGITGDARRVPDGDRRSITRTGQLSGGVFAQTLASMISSIGAIAQVIVRRHYTAATALGASVASSGSEMRGTARHPAIGNRQAQPAHPAGR